MEKRYAWTAGLLGKTGGKMQYLELEEKYKEWANLLKSLAHPVRLFIIELLAQGERSVNDIEKNLHIDVSTVSRHLSTLKRAGIINDKKKGNKVFYSLKIPCVLNFFKCTEQVLNEQLIRKIKILSNVKKK